MESTKPAAGMRDFLPEELAQRRLVLGRIRAVYERHDFRPIETPALERREILEGKYGEEGDQLMFRVLKRGDKLIESLEAAPVQPGELSDMGLRYDLTVPLCRVVAEYASSLPRIFKCYQTRPVWRADRPARGRFREFYQCDADIVGTTSLLAEVDVLTAAAEALRALGFEDFGIRINDRRLLSALVAHAGVPAGLETEALVALDKLDKVGREGVADEMAARGIPSAAADALGELVTPDERFGSPNAHLAHLAEVLPNAAAPIATLTELFGLLEQLPAVAPHVTLDATLARGLSYYTGPIFELTLPDYTGSVGGGGRYDDLIGMFLGRAVPACGISLGVERLMMILAEREMFDSGLDRTDVFICRFPDVTVVPGLRLAAALRMRGLRVDVYPETTRLKKQFALAERGGAAVVVIVGEDEVRDGTVGVKRMLTGEQLTVPMSEAVERVLSWVEGFTEED